MQNRDVNGHRVPMDTTVVDTGYGLERLTWLSQGTTSAYEAVFGDALAYLKRATGAKRVDDKVLREYSKVAGMLKVEDLADIREIRRQTAERVGISVEDLVAQVSPLEALYTVCDHARALIFLLGDGVVPSNAREGYFARLLVRRGLRALKDLNITYTLADAEPAKKIDILRDLPPTKLRVYEDKRKRSFRAKVLAVEGEAVVLDQTYFYPEGGGQEADHGTIADREVYDVQKVGPSVLHFVRGDAAPLLKTRVTCVIDGERREALMRNHTATHIVLVAARKVLGNQ